MELRGIPPNNYYGAVGPINRLLDAIGNNMSFADELNQIKKDRIRNDASQGKTKSVIISNVFKVARNNFV